MAIEDLPCSDITGDVITAFFRAYDALQFGYLESTYAAALTHELRRMGRRVSREFLVEVVYDGVVISHHRLDMVVDEKVVLEIKATYALHPIAERQLRSYLRSTRLEVGLLLHFGPKAYFKRVVALNDHELHRP